MERLHLEVSPTKTKIYQKANSYLDGVKLKVSANYMVPVLESGIVIFMGEKDGYGNTVVIAVSYTHLDVYKRQTY